MNDHNNTSTISEGLRNIYFWAQNSNVMSVIMVCLVTQDVEKVT